MGTDIADHSFCRRSLFMHWWEDIKDERDLGFVVQNHSALLSGDRIVTAVAAIPPSLAESPRACFLGVAMTYHLVSNQPQGSQDWARVHMRLKELEGRIEGDTLLAFYVPNYLLLSGRNAGRPIEELHLHFKDAAYAAMWQSELLGAHMRGFLEYNWSRTLLVRGGEPERAFRHYARAGGERVKFYLSVKGFVDRVILAAAATQVWKIGADVEKLFQAKTMEECGLDRKLFQEVVQLADSRFSAVKPS
jgi:hypothetical protein